MDERQTGSAGAAAAFIALITLLTLAALFAPRFEHPTVELLAAPTARPAGPVVELWLSTADRRLKLEPQPDIAMGARDESPATIVIDVGSAGFTFSPKVDTVATGGTVTWNWGGSGHSVISDGPPSFTSHTPLENAGFSYGPLTFNTAGSYAYHCSAHGNSSGGGMAGTIVVR